MRYIDDIIKIGESDGGYVTRRAIKEKNIPTVYLTRMVESGALNKLAEGIYILPEFIEDRIYTYALRYGRAVYSRKTALYLNGMTNRQLARLEANFPARYNTTKIEGIKCYRTSKDLYELGQTPMLTPFGHKVRSYDIERCICDLYYYDESDIEEKGYVIKNVDKRKLDYDKMFSYAKRMKVLTQVESVFEVIS